MTGEEKRRARPSPGRPTRGRSAATAGGEGRSSPRRGAGPRGRGGRARDEAEARERLQRAREARKAAKRAEAEAHRAREAEDEARRRRSWAQERRPIEPPIHEVAAAAPHEVAAAAPHEVAAAAPHEVAAAAPFRAGWVAIVGRPNVGKSTLLNALLGQKLAATSHKPQTTRKNLLGVLHPPGAQLLLLDTPGHHLAKGPLNRFMVAQAEAAVREADVVAFLVEARTDGRLTPGNERLLDVLAQSNKPVVAVLSKVDLLTDKSGLLHQMAVLGERLGERLAALVPISARTQEGLEGLVRELGRALPESAAIVAEDEITDQSESQIAGEFIREKAMLELEDELPYAVAVTVERFEDLRPRLVRIAATLHVERDSQKGIVIGRHGSRLKAIGARARKDIEFLLAAKVYLELEVRVTGDWTSDRKRLRELGYANVPRGAERASPQAIAEAIASLPEEVLAELERDAEVEESAVEVLADEDDADRDDADVEFADADDADEEVEP